MELEVRVVRAIESCFISLPLSLIQTLASTVSGPLPPVLALDLRSPAACWHVAWAGSASGSSSIEAVKEIEPALKKQLIISAALMTVGIAVVSWEPFQLPLLSSILVSIRK